MLQSAVVANAAAAAASVAADKAATDSNSWCNYRCSSSIKGSSRCIR